MPFCPPCPLSSFFNVQFLLSVANKRKKRARVGDKIKGTFFVLDGFWKSAKIRKILSTSKVATIFEFVSKQHPKFARDKRKRKKECEQGRTYKWTHRRTHVSVAHEVGHGQHDVEATKAFGHKRPEGCGGKILQMEDRSGRRRDIHLNSRTSLEGARYQGTKSATLKGMILCSPWIN